MERETGFEPATPTLARSCSTTELFPRHSATWYHGSVRVSPQGLGRVLGRHRVDEEPAAPLESRHARELRDSSGAAGDRKSTRLNSSHTVISYAVFCLK